MGYPEAIVLSVLILAVSAVGAVAMFLFRKGPAPGDIPASEFAALKNKVEMLGLKVNLR